MNETYPWQENDYKYLLQLKSRLPHAILLHGPKGIGADKVAYAFVQSLLCNESGVDDKACGKCNACLVFNDDSHPDFYVLAPDEDEKSISIAAVRAAVDFLSLTTHLSNYKIVLIEDANLLNLNSANALLKVLEEPSKQAVFILLSDNIQHLLPTIISRCHKYQLATPDTTTAKKFLEAKDISNADFWLNYNHNCPLFETEIDETQLERLVRGLSEPSVENIYGLTIEFDGKTVSSGFVLDFLAKWITDLVSYKLSGEFNYFQQYASMIEPLINKLQVNKAFYLHDKVNFLSKWSTHPLNFRLQIENLLFQYQQIFVA